MVLFEIYSLGQKPYVGKTADKVCRVFFLLLVQVLGAVVIVLCASDVVAVAAVYVV